MPARENFFESRASSVLFGTRNLDLNTFFLRSIRGVAKCFITFDPFLFRDLRGFRLKHYCRKVLQIVIVLWQSVPYRKLLIFTMTIFHFNSQRNSIMLL